LVEKGPRKRAFFLARIVARLSPEKGMAGWLVDRRQRIFGGCHERCLALIDCIFSRISELENSP
jgi:hypothetical protein